LNIVAQLMKNKLLEIYVHFLNTDKTMCSMVIAL